MDAPTAVIADDNAARAAQLRSVLGEACFVCTDITSATQIGEAADVLFIAGDTPGTSGSDGLVQGFAQRAPGAPIVVVTEAPLWRLITLAVRGRAWMDLPWTEKPGDLLARYATSRSLYPKIIVEASAARCAKLLDEWSGSSHCVSELSLVHSVGDSLEAAIDGRVPVLLNLSIPPGTLQSPDISTVIYSLCPAVIAVMIEASNTRPAYQNYMCAGPNSRFAVLKPPFRSSELKTLLMNMKVAWPMTSPL